MMRYVILIAMLMCLPVRGEAWQVVGGAVDYCAASVCSGCMKQERFECGTTAGDDDSDQETAVSYSSAGANTNDAYVDTLLAGSEGLYLSAAAKARLPITATGENLYFAVQAKPLAFSENSSNDFFAMLDSSQLNVVRILLVYGSGPKIDATTVTIYGVPTNNLADITDPTAARYWKMLFTKSSGASDGVCKIWHSDDGKNWTLRHDIANHNYTQDIYYVTVGASANNAYLFKDVRVSTSDINY